MHQGQLRTAVQCAQAGRQENRHEAAFIHSFIYSAAATQKCAADASSQHYGKAKLRVFYYKKREAQRG